MKSVRFFSFVCVFLAFPLLAQASFSGWHGFIEHNVGFKTKNDTTQHDHYNMWEERLQLRTTYYTQGDNFWAERSTTLHFRGDVVFDQHDRQTSFELRELNVSMNPWSIVDVKIGSQVLTWGTGDYLFINDMFPKDYESYFIGRDDEYLKKPSYAIRSSFYPQFANIDVVMIPYVTPNTIPDGDRLSFYDSFQGGITGRDSDRDLLRPPFQLSNSEYALRVYRNVGSHQAAFYFFHGFDKNPRSYKDEMARQLYYQPLDVYGVSVQGPFAHGIGNVELGYLYSRDDPRGDDRLVDNSWVKLMAGYRRDLGNDLNMGVQYLIEQRLDQSAYEKNLLPADISGDEFRHVLTHSVTKLFKNQTVTASIFTYYSPSDQDGYVRPSLSYDITDQWRAILGANIFWGKDDHTEFGQMKKNDNVYIRVRYGF